MKNYYSPFSVVNTTPVNLSTCSSRRISRFENHSGLHGFSLVEVVIAVGVAAFALVALLGLLPSGLKTFKSTMNTAVGSQIAQRVRYAAVTVAREHSPESQPQQVLLGQRLAAFF